MAQAVIDLDAVAHNTRLLAGAAGTAGLMAVVKANGFGHGATQLARVALQHGASWAGVTSAAEALALRADGIEAPILMWLYSPTETFEDLLQNGIDVSVSSLPSLAAVADAALRTGTIGYVHLKADTGLSRGGSPIDEWPDLVDWARKYEAANLLRVRGVWSHLANAENVADPRLRAQLNLFAEMRAIAGPVPVTHLANSAALLQLPETHLDLARPGIALYGVEPVPGKTFGLRPAMTLQAQVILTKRVPAGAGVSYGPDFVTDRETTLALLPVGFADGVPRSAGGRAYVAVNGVRCPIVGRIAMDQCVVDVGNVPVQAGDTAVLFGTGENGEATVADWAGWAGTNPHEVLTGVGTRVERQYLPVRKSAPRARQSIPCRIHRTSTLLD
jgi:alanine racemase